MSNYYDELVSLFNLYLNGVNNKLDSLQFICGLSLFFSLISLIIVFAIYCKK